MTPKSAKTELMDWLNNVSDPGLLAAMLAYKRSSEAEDPFAGLTEGQLASIDRGLEDMNAGRVRSSKEVWKKYGL